jgi:uncharacterized protein (TIGR02246 family)
LAQPTDITVVVVAFENAINAGDVATATALFAPDASLRTPGGQQLNGSEQIRPYLQALVAQHFQSEVVGPREVQGDTERHTASVAIDEWRQLGTAPLEATAEVVVRDGRIVGFSTVLTPESLARLQAASSLGPEELVRQYFAARNSGDVDRALALFTDDAVYSGGTGVCMASPCVGKEAIGQEIARLTAASRAEIVESQISGDRVDVRIEISGGAAMRAAGVDRVVNLVTAQVRDTRIADFRVTNDQTDPQTATWLAFLRAQASGQPATGGPAPAQIPAPRRR